MEQVLVIAISPGNHMFAYFPGHKERSGQIQPYKNSHSSRQFSDAVPDAIPALFTRMSICPYGISPYLPAFNNLFFLRNITLHRRAWYRYPRNSFAVFPGDPSSCGHNRQFGPAPQVLGHLYSKSEAPVISATFPVRSNKFFILSSLPFGFLLDFMVYWI